MDDVATAAPPDVPVIDDGRAAARGGLSLLVLQSLGRLVGLGFVVLATRHLVPAEFGRYSTAAALVVLGNFFADFGTSAGMTRLVSRRPASADDLLSGTVGASAVLGLFAYGAVVLFAVVSYSGPVVADVAIAALAIPSASVLSSLLGALDGVGLIARRATITATQTLLVASGVVPVLLGAGVRGALVMLALAPALSLVAAAAVLRRAGLWRSAPRVDMSSLRTLMVAALPFALTGGLSALSMRFDLVLLSLVSGPGDTAKYDLALRLLEAGTYLSTALTAPLFFLLSRRLGADDRDGAGRAYREAVRLIYLLGLPVSVGIAVLARPIVGLALGPEYAGAATPLAIMGGAQWLTWLTYAQGSLIMAGNFVRRGVAVAALLTSMTLLLDAVLIPAYGATGAAAAMVLAWSLSAVLFHRFHVRTSGLATPLPSIRLVAPAALLAATVLSLRQAPLLVPVVVGALVYGVALFVTGAVTADDRRRLTGLLRRQPA